MALAPAQAKREEAITLRTQADEAGYREWWAQILLLVAEAARSFGVWAFLMAGTRENARYGRRATDREEDQSADVTEPDIDASIDEAVAEPEPASEPPKPKNPNAQKGGESTAFNNETGRVDDSIPIDEPGAFDAERTA